jgi:hypothetical protein
MPMFWRVVLLIQGLTVTVLLLIYKRTDDELGRSLAAAMTWAITVIFALADVIMLIVRSLR